MEEKILECAGCNVTYRVTKPKADKTYRCPKCKEPLTEPEAAGGEGEQHTVEHDGEGQGEQMKDKMVGQVVEQYRIVEVIGRGGMGTVYKAEHMALGRMCALKILSPELVYRDQVYVDRFLREARAAGGLNHPNVVMVYNVGGTEDTYFIEMEYVVGQSLQHIMSNNRPLPFDRATHIALCVAKALEAAQQNALVHRDIKPDNILLGDDGSVKVTDFGLAKTVEAATHLTQTGSVMGTPYFMAPEQCDGEEADGRSDVYALGATYYYMLAGRLPYVGKTALAIMYKHKHDPVPDVRKLRPEFPQGIQEFLAKAMAKEPDDRYPSASEAVAELETLAEFEVETPVDDGTGSYMLNASAVDFQVTPTAEPPKPPHVLVQNRPLYNAVAVAAGVALGLLVLWLTTRQPGRAAVTPPAPKGTELVAAQPEPNSSHGERKGRTPKPTTKTKGRTGSAPTRITTGRLTTKGPAEGVIAVSQDGRGDYDSIAEALRHAKKGSTIAIQDRAIYADPWPAASEITALKDVAIQGVPGRPPTVPIDRAGPPVTLGEGWSVSCLRFSIHPEREEPAIMVVGHEAKIDTCFFVDGQCAISWASRSLDVSNCAFHNTGRGVAVTVLDGPEARVLRKLRFTHNTVYGWASVFTAPCRGPQDVRAELSDNAIAKASNLVHENPRDLMLWPASIRWKPKRNCYSRVAEFYRRGTKRALAQEITFSDWRPKKGDPGSFEGDPDFVDAEKRDLRLKPTSLCKGKAAEGKDLGVAWTDDLWKAWLAEEKREAQVARKEHIEKRKAQLAAGQLWQELAGLLAERQYEALIKRCEAEIDVRGDQKLSDKLKYWQKLAQVADHLVRRAATRATQLVGKKCTLVKKTGRGGKQRLMAERVMSVERDVIKILYFKKEMEIPFAELAADSVIELARESEQQTPARLVAEAAFLFGEGDDEAARKALAQIPKDAEAIQEQVATLTDHWEAVLTAKRALEREDKAEKMAQAIRDGIDAGKIDGLEALCQQMQTDYGDTAAFAKVSSRMAGVKLLVAGEAIMEQVKPRSARRFAPDQVRRTVARRMDAYRTKQIMVKKDGGKVKTIAAAIGQATPGTAIVIGDSETYQENLSISKPKILIRAAEGATPTIAPARPGQPVVVATAADVMLSGLRFVGGAGLSLSQCDNATISECHVSEMDTRARRAAGAIGVQRSAGVIIADNTIRDSRGNGIYIDASPDAILTQNQCVGNSGDGISVRGTASLVGNLAAYNGTGIGLRAPSQATETDGPAGLLEGNVVWRNLGPGVLGQSWPPRLMCRYNLAAINAGPGISIIRPTRAESAVVNNVLCANWGGPLAASRTAPTSAKILVRDNVVSGALFEGAWPVGDAAVPTCVLDRNIVFSAESDGAGRKRLTSLEQWQGMTKQSLNSQWVKPVFAEPERHDFRLQKDEERQSQWGLPSLASFSKRMSTFAPVLDNPAMLHKAAVGWASDRRERASWSRTPVKVSKRAGGVFKSIGAALAKATPNMVIEITDSSTYAESLVIDKPGVLLRAAANAKPVIQAPKESAFAVSVQAPNVGVVGLKIVSGENGILVGEEAVSPIIANNTIEDAADTGIYLAKGQDGLVTGNACVRCKDGIVVEQSRNVVLLDNRCVLNREKGILVLEASSVSAMGNVCRGSGTSGFVFESCQGVSLVNNLGASNKGSGISLKNVSDLSVEQNTLYGNTGAGLHAEALRQWVRIAANVSANNQCGIDCKGWTQVTPAVVAWNGVHANADGFGRWDGAGAADLDAWQKASKLGEHSTAATPGFEDAKNGDLRIRKGEAYSKKAPDGGAIGVRWDDETWGRYMPLAAGTAKKP